jgi:excisionase family DNA binding protein
MQHLAPKEKKGHLDPEKLRSNPPQILSLEEAAICSCVSPRTLWDHVDQGKLKSVRLGRRRLIRLAALNEYMEGLEA